MFRTPRYSAWGGHHLGLFLNQLLDGAPWPHNNHRGLRALLWEPLFLGNGDLGFTEGSGDGVGEKGTAMIDSVFTLTGWKQKASKT